MTTEEERERPSVARPTRRNAGDDAGKKYRRKSLLFALSPRFGPC